MTAASSVGYAIVGGAWRRTRSFSRWRQVTLPHLFRQWSVRFAAGPGVTDFDPDSTEPGQVFTPAQLKELLTTLGAWTPHIRRGERHRRLWANDRQGLRIGMEGGWAQDRWS